MGHTKKVSVTRANRFWEFKIRQFRAVTKISSCQVHAASRRGIKQHQRSGGGTFLADGGNPRLPPLNDSSGVYMGAEKNGVL